MSVDPEVAPPCHSPDSEREPCGLGNVVVGAGHKKADDHVRERQPNLAVATGPGMRNRIEQTPPEKGDEAGSSWSPAFVVEHPDAGLVESLIRGGGRAVDQHRQAWTNKPNVAFVGTIDRVERRVLDGVAKGRPGDVAIEGTPGVTARPLRKLADRSLRAQTRRTDCRVARPRPPGRAGGGPCYTDSAASASIPRSASASRSLRRQRIRVGPMLPMGMSSSAEIDS